jgi:hypothetical protein
MRKIICDICNHKVEESLVIRAELMDGEHPHNGSTMWKDCDVCPSCMSMLSKKTRCLQIRIELDDARIEAKK